MFDDIAAYYHENVVSAYIDYRERKKSDTAGCSKDVRRAVIAASALFHLREHLPTNIRPSRTATERACPEYGLLADIVNATKHKTITKNTPHGLPLVTDATQISEQIIVTEYQDEEGLFRFSEKVVVVKLTNGSERDLFEVLTIVLNYWEKHLYSSGILTNLRTFSFAATTQPKTRKECEENQLNFELVRGHRFHQSMRLQRYNYVTKSIEPIDLTGSQIEFRIYKPNFIINLSLKHNESGTEFKKTITLSDEENNEILNLKTDEEKQSYINSLPAAQEALRQLAIEAGLLKV